MPKYPFINFWDPEGKYFLSLSHLCNINYEFEKYSSIILATICQRFRYCNPSVCIPNYLFVNFWEPKGNYVFSLRDSCNINYKHTQKKYSIILGIIYHSLRKLNPSEHMPKYPFVNFWDPKVKYFLSLNHSCNFVLEYQIMIYFWRAFWLSKLQYLQGSNSIFWLICMIIHFWGQFL